MEEKRTSSRKVRVGKVVSDKMDKTVVVASVVTARAAASIATATAAVPRVVSANPQKRKKEALSNASAQES